MLVQRLEWRKETTGCTLWTTSDGHLSFDHEPKPNPNKNPATTQHSLISCKFLYFPNMVTISNTFLIIICLCYRFSVLFTAEKLQFSQMPQRL